MKNEDLSTKRILEILQSTDSEMAILGIRLALEKGAEWIKENIPYFGPFCLPLTGTKLLKSGSQHDRMYIKGDVAIYISPRRDIDARYLVDFPATIINYTNSTYYD